MLTENRDQIAGGEAGARFHCSVQYGPPDGADRPGDDMLEELIQKAEDELERIQRLRGYL
jgi:hypothetical protein